MVSTASKGYVVDLSKFEENKFSFCWGIEQLPKRLHSIGERFFSPVFEAAPGVLLCVCVTRKAVAPNEEWFSAYVCISSESTSSETLTFDYSITALRSPPKQDFRIKICGMEFNVHKANFELPQWFPFANIMDPAEGFLEDGHLLTIFVEGNVYTSERANKFEEESADLETAISRQTAENHRKMFAEGLHTDFVVKAKDANGVERELTVHKGVLAAGSEVFAAMLSHPESKECREEVFEVTDVSYEVMEALVRFLYTGKLPRGEYAEGIELDLLIAADKYQLDGLKLLQRQLDKMSASSYVFLSKYNQKRFSFQGDYVQFPQRLQSVGARFCTRPFEAAPGIVMHVEFRRTMVVGEEWLSAHFRISQKSSLEEATLSDHSIVLLRLPPKQDHQQKDTKTRQIADDKWGWKKFLPFANLLNPSEGFLEDGHLLTILVEGSVATGERINETEIVLMSDLDAQICKHNTETFRKMFAEGLHTDFMVKAKDANGVERELKVHKGVLAAGSEVFGAMLSHPESKECLEGMLEITDFPFQVIEVLVRFLYTGKLPRGEYAEGFGLDLLIAADKYEIDGLKKLVERQLPISTENACGVFLYSKQLKAPFLRIRCVEFMRLNLPRVVETEGWRQLFLPENAYMFDDPFWSVHTDFMLKAKDANGMDKELTVHKAVLAAGSKVFAKMLENPESKESLERVHGFDNMRIEVIEALVRFLYTGKLPRGEYAEGFGLDLLIAADKYEIDGLKELIERQMVPSEEDHENESEAKRMKREE